MAEKEILSPSDKLEDHGDEAEVSNSQEELDRHIVHPGSQLLIRLPTGEIRHVHVDAKLGERSINLGKFGCFRVKELVGQPFGLTYEIQKDKSLVVLAPKRLEELGM